MILTSFPFCCLQFCRLSFLLYVIKLRFVTGSSMGGGLAKKLKKRALGTRSDEAAHRRIESISL